jgi:hypothetical protein
MHYGLEQLHVLLMQMKLQAYDIETGGELMDTVAPKLDAAVETLTRHIPSLPIGQSDVRVRTPSKYFISVHLLLVDVTNAGCIPRLVV